VVKRDYSKVMNGETLRLIDSLVVKVKPLAITDGKAPSK
jgi:hypothetical protein